VCCYVIVVDLSLKSHRHMPCVLLEITSNMQNGVLDENLIFIKLILLKFYCL
jgi:hypothetical protein